jgi:hypothetical protein
MPTFKKVSKEYYEIHVDGRGHLGVSGPQSDSP